MKKFIIKTRLLFFVFSMFAYISSQAQVKAKLLWKNNAFVWYPDSIIQGNYKGVLSGGELSSNYKSPANEFLSPSITFKFSINGKDNEMVSGIDHHFICIGDNGNCVTPAIKFGKQFVDNRVATDNTYLRPGTKFTIRLDMKDVLSSFEKDGYFTTFKGEKIYKQDFKGVYVAGNPAPLSWDFDNLVNQKDLLLKDDDKDGIYETTLVLNDQRNEKQTASSWKLTSDVSAFPSYQSAHPLSDALYNLALEEMQRAVEPDSTFRTGKEWAGVWTRDISYSIILSMAYLQPHVSRYSLLRKVKNGRIIQDTGTGGAYPVSTDRMIWAVAAWELYKATGDEIWLKEAYLIIKNSIDDDLQNAYDKQTGLVKGESSFLDWREQTYPKWMQPADIFESQCLGTNAVHYQANIVLSEMAKLLGKKAEAVKYQVVAKNIKNGVNRYLWMKDKGYYGQFLYGKNFKILSPRSEALGEALTVLFGIADSKQQHEIISKTPVMDFGIPCIYPQIPGIPPYHNNAVWPFVQSYWALAAAKAGNEEAVMESLASIYRPAALFLTNKENFVATNGDFAGTQINSSNMLWSLAGNIAMVHKLLFGIRFEKDSLTFQPFVPSALAGERKLTGLKYRNATLDIIMEGSGNKIKSFTLDDKPVAARISKKISGHHQVKIVLSGNSMPGKIHSVPSYFSPRTPLTTYENKIFSWQPVDGAAKYRVINNGKMIKETTDTTIRIADAKYAELQVIAIDSKGVESFASEPLQLTNNAVSKIVEIESFAATSDKNFKGFSGTGFVELSTTANKKLDINISLPADGVYAIDFKYANGNGPVNTENKCAIRTLKEGNKTLGVFVLPQRGKEEWSNWGYTSPVISSFKKGSHRLSVVLERFNENMNGEVNQAMLDHIRIIKIK